LPNPLHRLQRNEQSADHVTDTAGNEALRQQHPAELSGQLSQSPDSYIVAAVDNPRPALASHSGSTPRGYDGAIAYGPSLRARQDMHSIAAQYGLREVTTWPIEALHIHCAVFKIPPAGDRNAILAALARDQRIKLVQPLQTFTTQTEVYNDPYVGLQRGLEMMDIADAHPLSRGEGVKVALIDTGADITHPDLRSSVSVMGNFVDTNAAQFKQDIHGTEVAGVIAAMANNKQGIVGISPGARLMIFKACWQLLPDEATARCNSFTLAKALMAALDARAQVINLSLAGPDDLLLRNLIQEGVRRGVLFVGAAPAGSAINGAALLRQEGVIAVATAEESRTSTTSLYAPSLYAPGREILTLTPGGHYGFASGSSLATAHVTGAVALLLARNSTLTSASVYQLLNNSTAPVASSAGAISSVDACAAVVALLGRGECKRPPAVSKLPRSDISSAVKNQ
jgi:subtilisin family serine protease